METSQHEDGVTLKEILLTLQDFTTHLWSKKIWIILAGLVGGAIGFYVVYTTPKTYSATLTFMINEDEGISIGGLGSVLGQFGFDAGGGGDFSLEKIVALSKSRQIAQHTLLSLDTTHSDATLLANEIIEVENINEEWKEDSLLNNFLFPDDSRLETLQQKAAFKSIHSVFVGDSQSGTEGLIATAFDDDTGILSLVAKTQSADLSIALVKKHYAQLSNFYISKSTEKQRQTVKNLTAKTDSIVAELKLAEAKLANRNDRALGTVLSRDNIARKNYARQVQVLSLMYAEVLKNKETASFLLKNATPFFHIIDEPLAPIKPARLSYKKYVVVAGLLGGLFVALLLSIQRIWVKVME